jgi:hypothetical protein
MLQRNVALDCFSTILMWRQCGTGELYLVCEKFSLTYVVRLESLQYAPKDRQNPSLCKTPPQSVCNDDYGLSIGRGSFYFSAGSWTHIQQTVGLNTPGRQDGTFVLFVNNKLIMNLTQILYRDGPQSSSSKRDILGLDVDGLPLGLGGLLPSILGPLESILGVPSSPTSPPSENPHPKTHSNSRTSGPKSTNTDQKPTTSATSTLTSRPTQSFSPPLQFSGVFFRSVVSFNEQRCPLINVYSTFFGGHGTEYETPRDQYTWFKDFALQIDK